MRYINTRTLELGDFSEEESAPLYAVFSSSWAFDEISFHRSGHGIETRSSVGIAKLQTACQLASSRGIDWLWAASSCIDFSRTSELVDSTIRRSQILLASEVYIVYLDDLDSRPGPGEDWESTLRHCKWLHLPFVAHEIISSAHIEFYNRHWNLIGTKESFMLALCRIMNDPHGLQNNIPPLSLTGQMGMKDASRFLSHAPLLRLDEMNFVLRGDAEDRRKIQRLAFHRNPIPAWNNGHENTSVTRKTEACNLNPSQYISNARPFMQKVPTDTLPLEAQRQKEMSSAHELHWHEAFGENSDIAEHDSTENANGVESELLSASVILPLKELGLEKFLSQTSGSPTLLKCLRDSQNLSHIWKRIKPEGFMSFDSKYTMDSEDEDTLIIESRSSSRLSFACPFYLKAREEHRVCFNATTLFSIEDVIQHICSTHRRPPRCAICGDTFADYSTRDRHILAQNCILVALPETEGVSFDQIEQISENLSHLQTAEFQWYLIWNILFPAKKQPWKPHLCNDTERVVQMIRDHWSHNGMDIILEYLKDTTSNDLTESGENVEDIHRLVLKKMIEEIVRGHWKL